MSSTTKVIDQTFTVVDNVYNNTPEVIRLKKLRYYYGEILECLELSDALFEEIRENSKQQKNFEAETRRDTESVVDGIAEQIQRAMASLDIGDHAIVVVRKDSSEAVDINA